MGDDQTNDVEFEVRSGTRSGASRPAGTASNRILMWRMWLCSGNLRFRASFNVDERGMTYLPSIPPHNDTTSTLSLLLIYTFLRIDRPYESACHGGGFGPASAASDVIRRPPTPSQRNPENPPWRSLDEIARRPGPLDLGLLQMTRPELPN